MASSELFEQLRASGRAHQPPLAISGERRGKPVLNEAKLPVQLFLLSQLGSDNEVLYPCFPLVSRLEEIRALLWLRGEARKKAVEQLAKDAVNRLGMWIGEELDRTKTRRQAKGFEGLGQKKVDLSIYLDAAGLTDRQRDCFSMKLEYELSVAEIARRLGKHHSTVQYHLEAAGKRIEHARARESRAQKRARAGAE